MKTTWWLAMTVLTVLTSCGRQNEGSGGSDYHAGPQGAQGGGSSGNSQTGQGSLMDDTYNRKVTNGTTPMGTATGVGTASSGSTAGSTNSSDMEKR